MLERSPASLMSALEEAVRADLLVDDGEHLRFRHDLLREATRQSLPQSLRRAMERQSASVMLALGAAPAEVATQLARSAEPGDREAIDALRQAAQSVGHNDASAAADLCKRALELLPADDSEHGSLVAETVELLNRASRYGEAEELAIAALSQAASPEEEAEIRLRRLERRIVAQPRAKTGWDSLTDSELKVINLIAQGATNRSVAQQLHLSLHTVKTHVHNAFAKLGIASRAQLARLMRGSD